VFTNSAAHQVGGSPTVQTDNTSLAESAITFTNDSEQVCTLGHFIPVSLQALGDSNFLSSYINNRLMYGLKLKEETELLTGTGTLGTISGINTNATAYAQAFSPHTYDQDIEYIRDARRQLEVANYQPSVIILHPSNYAALELRRETSNGQFIVGDPRGAGLGSIWGLRVVVSVSQTSGTATLVDPSVFQIFDREDAAVEVSFEEGNNFTKLMATVRAYERLAFVSYSTLGAVKITGLTA
jgi:HK97 family phage major capsid protein